MDLVKFLEFLTAILFAFWFKREIPLFAKRINRQTYDEFYSLVNFQLNYSDFEKQSKLKIKKSKLFYGHFLYFYSLFLYFPFKERKLWAGRQFIINRFIASFYVRADVTSCTHCFFIRDYILPNRTMHDFAKTAKIAFYSVY